MKRKALYLAMMAICSATLIACSGDDGKDGVNGTDGTNGQPGQDGNDAYTNDITFYEVAPAVTDTEKNTIRTSTKVSVGGEMQNIDYTTLLYTGDEDNGEVYGRVKDYQDNVIKNEDESDYMCNGTEGGLGSGLDHFSILQKNDKLYMVSQFECSVGAMYINELEQDANGELSAKEGTLQFVSQAAEFGGFTHCAGMTTPWESHLGSEEYEPDARNPGGKYYDEVSNYFWAGDASKNNPYYYGWTPEVQVNDAGEAVYMKHYSMGRFAHELAYVMPDEKTVYLSDDGTNVGLFMFVADEAKDLSAGTLYAAKWSQVSAEGLGDAVISWIDMGHASNDQVRAVVAAQPAFSDVFDVEDQVDGACATAGFTPVTTANGSECLKLKDIDGSGAVDATDGALAARLETRRYAAMMGATTEFRKEEGITFNARDNKLYVAMSDISSGMVDDEGDIQVETNRCGGVYSMSVALDETIGSAYVAYNMKGLVAGQSADYTGTALEGNSCDVDGIASPDNVAFLEGTDILVIGEDTSSHPNDMVWAYDITKKSLARIATTPYGSETTSPYWYKDINGFGYLTLTTQHPFGEVDKNYQRPETVDIRSTAGYVGPFDFSKLK
ncbi:PhoX family protein [Teredinibacter turnerae]|uniref:PhoX family protein n=1 Tax=Teredinibacter turnerae TaxID=2426 RepID=UPI00036E6B29|nr:alkaline phosphatase PhoX [Teredinibacter turnerae]